MSKRASMCHHCDRFYGVDRCAAFPDGIPDGILAGAVDHRQPVDGDRGFRFVPAEDFDAAAYFDSWVFELPPAAEPDTIA